jgi:SPOR domain
MSISRARRVLAAIAVLFVAAAAEGCARTPATPAGRPREAAPAPARPPSQAGASPARPASRPGDPSEEITPEELESIPEPVPGASHGEAPATSRSEARTAQEAPQGDSVTASHPPTPGVALWRVQIFATQDRVLADRTAGEAARLLGVKARVDFEGTSYKVRLGDYGSEGEAGSLRDQAVRSGYPGAFRIRCAPTTINKG